MEQPDPKVEPWERLLGEMEDVLLEEEDIPGYPYAPMHRDFVHITQLRDDHELIALVEQRGLLEKLPDALEVIDKYWICWTMNYLWRVGNP